MNVERRSNNAVALPPRISHVDVIIIGRRYPRISPDADGAQAQIVRIILIGTLRRRRCILPSQRLTLDPLRENLLGRPNRQDD